MTCKHFIVGFAAVLLGMLGLLVWAFCFGPKFPIALLRVVDAANHPIAGAVVRPEGMRTKPGPYVSGWYGWYSARHGPTNSPVKTDAKGYARIAYPKYVFERIETGVLCLSVEHPDYVPARPEARVAFAPPAGAPWRVWADYLLARFRGRALVYRTDPIVLQKGAALRVSVKNQSNLPKDTALLVQVAGLQTTDPNFWVSAGPGALLTKRLMPGPQTFRLVALDAEGSPWFSQVVHTNVVAEQTNELALDLKHGVAVSGALDDRVPRPMRDGCVVAHVWPQNEDPQNAPPQWHTWSNIREDGTFDLGCLPEGELEVVGICDGYVSTNGPGQFRGMHYPQKALLGTNNLTLTIGMEPTVCLAVMVEDDQGKPLKNARVLTYPNVRYGEWSATILGSDCYRTADGLRGVNSEDRWSKSFSTFEGTSDASGRALIRNLPLEVGSFSVEHPGFALPAKDTSFGQKRREESIRLEPGRTNRITVQLEPVGQSAISHY